MLLQQQTEKSIYRFFRSINLMNQDNQPSRSKAEKIGQILAYLEVIRAQLKRYSRKRKLVLVECAAGNCYLSLLVYHYYTQIEKRPIEIHCIDTNERLMQKTAELAQRLKFDNMVFHAGDIDSYRPKGRIDLVFSLHACDTATDKTLYLGVMGTARCVLSVSCCQHTMKKTMRGRACRGLTKHRVLKERLLYMVGDAMRALLLEMRGYRVDVIDFVSSRHTGKNIMVRAQRVGGANQNESTAEYQQLKEAFNLTPPLEQYLYAGEQLTENKIQSRAGTQKAIHRHRCNRGRPMTISAAHSSGNN